MPCAINKGADIYAYYIQKFRGVWLVSATEQAGLGLTLSQTSEDMLYRDVVHLMQNIGR